jgi:uncharacterized C2H2 Zn-finger protein
MVGYYAFQDYAVLHWVDHLEALVPFLNLEILDHADDTCSAIIDFYEAHGAEDAGREDISEELKERCQHIKDAKFFEELLLLLSYTRKVRAKEEKVAALGELGGMIEKTRSILESLHLSTIDGAAKEKLEQYYGLNWNKCPRHACYYFHEGFTDAFRRDNHVARHEKPFCCIEPSCPRIHLGFSTKKELDKHMNINHPDPAAFAWKFPKPKKPPPKHICDICSKDFTRAHNLKAHKRTHANERPFGCSFCGKAFVRKHDRERHVEKLHPEKNEQMGESSQGTLVGSEMDTSEIDIPELQEETPTTPLASDGATPG